MHSIEQTMFYTFHKNWQCVKSALNCFCFWSLYIFLGNLLCIQNWGKSKNLTKSIFLEFWKTIESFWAYLWFTIHDECIGLKLWALLLEYSSCSFLRLLHISQSPIELKLILWSRLLCLFEEVNLFSYMCMFQERYLHHRLIWNKVLCS